MNSRPCPRIARYFLAVFRWIFLGALISGATLSPVTAGEAEEYLRGYVDSLLDIRFPGLGLRSRAVSTDGSITLTSRTCLGLSQKRDVEYLLGKTGRVKNILWGLSTDCDRSDAVAMPDSVGSGGEAAAPVDVYALPERELFAPLLADPRQPRFSVSYLHYRSPASEFSAASVAFGEYFGLASGFFGSSGSSQIGIQGGVFALFNLDAPSSDLINADYWIGLPVSYRKGPWSYLLRLYHQSSHLGDEFILGNPGLNRVNLSYEDLEFLTSYEWERWRLYGGGGYILNSEPDLSPMHLQAGAEYVRPRTAGRLSLIAAMDVQAYEELDWRRSRSYQVGFELRSGSLRQVRLMLEHFRGHSPNGQFYRDPVRYTGLGLYFGF